MTAPDEHFMQDNAIYRSYPRVVHNEITGKLLASDGGIGSSSTPYFIL